jgi:hypothetical protein
VLDYLILFDSVVPLNTIIKLRASETSYHCCVLIQFLRVQCLG